MWVRQLKRKTTKNITIQIVQSYRNKKGEPRVRIIRHMGSARPNAVDPLIKLAELELAKLQEGLSPLMWLPHGIKHRIRVLW